MLTRLHSAVWSRPKHKAMRLAGDWCLVHQPQQTAWFQHNYTHTTVLSTTVLLYMLLLLIKTIFQPVLNGTMKLGILFTVVYTSLMFSKIQEILLAHIAIISDSPTLHWDTNNQNLPGDKDYRSDPPPGYPISPLDGCYAETQASAGCQLTRLSRHKPQTFATLPGIWHS